MKEKKRFRFSIKMKILVGSVLINVLICVVMGFCIYKYVRATYLQSVCDDTLAICRIAAGEINGNLLSLLDEGMDNSYANTVVQENMDKVLQGADLYAIYTIGERNGDIVYLSQPVDYGFPIGMDIQDVYKEEVRNAMANPASFKILIA